MYELRPYQEEARRAIHEEWDSGRRKTLVVAATGTGKTVIFGAIAKDCVDDGERVLILAHRGELLEQAADKLKNAYNLDSALEKAESTSLGSMNMVTVGSVQSFCREKRLTQFPKDYFSTIIVDEAHHVLSDTYQRVLEHFDGAKVLGMTATPDRGDMKDLGVFFDSLAYEYPIAKAVKDGYLCPIKAQMIPLQIDLSHVKMSAGDYSAGDAGNAIEPYLEQIASEMEQYCKKRKTVVFLPLIAISQKFCAILQERGFRAAEVNGESDDRKEILEAFDAGEYDVLCNSMLLTEGWDCPSVDCIVVLRPTKMRGLYCLDEETEILTERGWRKGADLGERVAAFDTETGEIVFTKTIAKVERVLTKDECFYTLQGQSTDVRVTNRHRMVYGDKWRHGWRIDEAERVAEEKGGVYLPVAGHYSFKGVPLTDAEIAFIGRVMAFGSVNKCNDVIYLSARAEREEECKEIENGLIDCGLQFGKVMVEKHGKKQARHGGKVMWYIAKETAKEREAGKTGWKHLEEWISEDMSPALFEMTANQFAVMLEAMHLGDGAESMYTENAGNMYRITKSNKTFTERLQIMAVLRGYRASICTEKSKTGDGEKDAYTLSLKRQDYIDTGAEKNHGAWKKEAYREERCWCVQNELGTLITRRHGKVTIVGNCQMVGRGMRLAPNKEDLLLLDFLWLTEKHDLCRPSALISKSAETTERMDSILASGKDAADIVEVEARAEGELLGEREKALAETLEKTRHRRRKTVDPLQYAISIEAEELVDYVPAFAWESEPATEKQLEMLERKGIHAEAITCKGQAARVIDHIVQRQKQHLATPKQIQCLERYGFRHVGQWKFDEASGVISFLAKNGWKLPHNIVSERFVPNSLRKRGAR